MLVRFDHGVHLPGADLWLDPHQARPAAVVSHAHADHVRRHETAVVTAPTAALMRRRGVVRCRFTVLPYGKPLQAEHATVTLYPAGHILGSAQVLVEREGCRLLYSGDFKLRPGRSAEATVVPEADIVIMETTFGRPKYRFPDPDDVMEQIREFCRATLAEGKIPVLLCYSLGKGQEVLAGLEGCDFPIYLQEAHWNMTALYRDFGVRFPAFRKHDPGGKLDGVLLCAGGCRKAAWFDALAPRARLAYISGWAADSGSRWRFKVDAAFPLSDHADYPGLLEYVRRTGARKVYTLHGFMNEFAGDLRRQGLWAEPLRAEEPQLTLSLE
jgi:Cft2 family RNA processing exonuclease